MCILPRLDVSVSGEAGIGDADLEVTHMGIVVESGGLGVKLEAQERGYRPRREEKRVGPLVL